MTASLDGELHRVGGAYCSVDAIIGPNHRADSIAAEAPDYAIAEQRTAAWIYGLVYELSRPLQLCVDSRTRKHPVSSRLHVFREVVIVDDEVRTIGTLRVTSPLRTAVDLVRFSDTFLPSDRRIVRRLAAVGTFRLADCIAAINGRKNLPNKHRALGRLAEALDPA